MNTYAERLKRLIAGVLVAALLLLGSAVPALAETFSAIVTANTMTVYGEASLTEKLGTLAKNTVVRVTGYSSVIAKFSYQGQIGYAKVSDLKRVEDVATRAVATAAAPIFQSPDTASASVLVPAGTRLYVLATSGEWAQVEKGGAVGYVKTGYLEAADEDWNTASTPSATPAASAAVTVQPTKESGITVRTYTAVTVESTRVYQSASEKARSKGTLKPGVQLTVLATSSNGWAYIELNGKHGFCKSKSLKEGIADEYAAATPAPSVTPAASQSGTPGVVNVDTLPVYATADTDGILLGTLKLGQQVNVIRWNGKWAYIELNNRFGFCDVTALSKPAAQTAPATTFSPSTVNAKKGKVTASALPVYQTAGTGGTKLGTLKKGQTVNVIQSSDGWAYIELNGRFGFCSASGIAIEKKQDGVPAGYKQADFTATVVTPEARAYASANTDAENVILKLGTEVQVAGYNKTWACITQNGNTAFVPVKALSKASYAAIDSDGAALQTLLKALLSGGYFDGIPSTSYNAAAIAAIKRFQSACGMEETGVADQNMLRVVYSGHAPVSSLLYSTLAKGDRSDSVSRLQARLYALGYLCKTGSLTGEYSDTTVSAVKLFQTVHGITANGTADTTTLRALYNTGAKKLPDGAKAADYTAVKTTSVAPTSTYMNQVPEGLASTTSSLSSGMTNEDKLEYVIYLAQSKLGCPYVYGATGPSKFDCSGLTVWIFDAVGMKLKRTAYNQGYDDTYEKIEGWKNLRRGDIVFFNTISDSDLSDHAGVYLGDGYFIHASSGAHKVVVSNLTTGYYARVFSWGRRILK